MRRYFHRSVRLLFFSVTASLLLLPSSIFGGELLRGGSDSIPNQYIVTLKPNTARNMTFESRSDLPEVARIAEELLAIQGRYSSEILHIYENALEGFAVRMDEETARAMAEDSRVLVIEPDGWGHAAEIQQNATWGIDRIDQKNLPLSKTYEYTTTASNVHVYVLDTGLYDSHTEFSGRVGNGYDAVGDGNGTLDQHGHGTHCAGTILGTQWGVAKGATIHPVQILDKNGSGQWSQIAAGADWVTANHKKPAVASMSLQGTGFPTATVSAINGMINAGVFVVGAAGNYNVDACTHIMGSTNSMTVAASNSSDSRWSSSNWGSCVEIFAPGENVTSASHTSTTGSRSMSGTSMATPHVAGVAALYLANNPNATPSQVQKAILDASTPDKISDVKGSPNKLLYSLLSSGPAPTMKANFDFTVSQLSVSFTDRSTATLSSITTWRWSFGDGGRSDLKNPSYSYSQPGTYNVVLTVSNDATSDRITKAVTVEGSASKQIAFDGFETGTFTGGEGWVRSSWKKSGNVAIISSTPYEGKYYVRMRKNTGYMKQMVDLSKVSAARLRIAARARSFEDGDQAFIKVSRDNVTYETVKTFTISDSDNKFHLIDIDLKKYLPANPLRLVIESKMSGLTDYLYIDNVEIISE